MHIPERLFYSPKRIKNQYTTQFTGNLDFNRAQARDPKCWRRNIAAGAKKKKTIVLSDFLMETLPEFIIYEAIRTLSTLMKEGFSVYLWQKDGPIKLEQHTLNQLHSRNLQKQCSPIHPDELIKIMNKKGVPKEGVAIFDYNHLQQLQSEMNSDKFTPENDTSINIEFVANSSFSWTEISQALPLQQRWHTSYLGSNISKYYSRKRNLALTEVSQIDGITLGDNYHTLLQANHKSENLSVIGPGVVDLVEVLNAAQHAMHIRLIHVDDIEYNPTEGQKYPSVITLDLSACNEMAATDLAIFIINASSSMLNLHNIILGYDGVKILEQVCDLLKQHYGVNQLDDRHAAFLQQVKFYCTDVSFSDSGQLKQFRTTLAELGSKVSSNIILSKLTISAEPKDSLFEDQFIRLLGSPAQVGGLQILKGKFTGIDHVNFKSKDYLWLAGSVEPLCLSLAQIKQPGRMGLNNVDDARLFSQYQNPSLNILDINFSKNATVEQFSFADLEHFAPNLYHLNITKPQNMVNLDIAPERPFKFQHLTELSVDCDPLTSLVIFQKLIHAAPNLAFVDLMWREGADEDKLNFTMLPDMNQLKGLHFQSDGSIDVHDFMKNMKNLTDLKLVGKIFFDRSIMKDSEPDYSLEHLHLENTDPSSSPKVFPGGAVNILKRSPNLTTLYLRDISLSKNLLSALKLTKLEKLKKIHIADAVMTLVEYEALRALAPNLEELTFENCVLSQPISVDAADLRFVVKNCEETQSAASPPKSEKIVSQGDAAYRSRTSIRNHTAKTDQAYNVPKVFYDIYGQADPDVREYRLSVYNTLTFTKSNDAPYDLSAQGDPKITVYNDYHYGEQALKNEIQRAKKDSKKAFLARHEIRLTNEFQPIPSLQSYEALKALTVSGLARDEIEIGYSERDNLYLIRKKTPDVMQTSIEYLVDVTNKPQSKPDARLKTLINQFDKFKGPGELDRSKLSKNATPQEELEAMFEQGLGRCELRTAQLKHLAQKRFGNDDVRIVNNDCHSFAEIHEGAHWIKYDLGGYEAQVSVNEPAKSDLLPSNQVKTNHNDDRYNALHQTWEVNTGEANPELLAQNALAQIVIDEKTGNRIGQNVLLQCGEDEAADELMLTLQRIARASSRPYFVIDTPEQIACAGSWIKRDLKSNSGSIMDGPGGPLHDFLSQDFKGQSPVLLVNWNNFDADELVRFNTLIDAQRHADNTKLPQEMVVAGVYNTAKLDAYKGSDFSSRNPVKIKVPISARELAQLNHAHTHMDIPTVALSKDREEIELYNASNWHELLLGQWIMEAGKLIFEEGPLAKALKAGKPVHLKNAPWHLSEFNTFWQRARIDGHLNTVGEKINIPNDYWQTLTQSTGYRWQDYADCLNFSDALDETDQYFAINSDLVNNWVKHVIVENHLAVGHRGLFEKFKNYSVTMLVSEHISEPQWAKLLETAKQYNVKLNLVVPKGITLPDSLEQAFKIKRAEKPLKTEHEIVETSDVNYSLDLIKSEYIHNKQKIPLVIDVSEFDESDILYKVVPDFTGKDIRFDTKFSQIWEMIEQGETVILKGHFSQSLKNYLSEIVVEDSLYIHGKLMQSQGKLIMIADEPFSKALSTRRESPTLREKLELVIRQFNINDAAAQLVLQHHWPENSTIDQIRAGILHYSRTSPPSFDFNQAIQQESIKFGSDFKAIDLSDLNVNAVCKKFEAERMTALFNQFMMAPYAFVGGPTGVGKSTFMQTYITPENGFHLYNEMSELKKWAIDRTQGKSKILFIDEANIADIDYMIFDGLYQKPPVILIEGEVIELTPLHKVVFAGNPMSYGGERHLPNFIAQHGNACTFNPMPPEYIYRNVLAPVFSAAHYDDSQSKYLSKLILETYCYICSSSEGEILISPRELKLMAMSMVANAGVSPERTIYNIAHQCLPDNLKNKFEAWHPFKPNTQKAKPIQLGAQRKNKFILTPSRVDMYQNLVELLDVRQVSVSSKEKALQHAGLGGMLVEGEPGTGKSHFLIDVLIERGYERIQPPAPNKPIPPLAHSKQFYYIPASLSFDEKKRILLIAFNQGAIVVTDEINSGPMMEQLLNALLMGQHPDTKLPPDKPGFMLLATQNPISMAGRQETSRAIRRRLLFQEFNPLPRDEMESILKQKFGLVPESEIKAHVGAHLSAVAYAKEHHLEPAPVFRDLHNIVEKEQLSRNKKLQVRRETIDITLDGVDKENVVTPVQSPIVKRKMALSRSYDNLKHKSTPLKVREITVGGDSASPKQKN